MGNTTTCKGNCTDPRGLWRYGGLNQNHNHDLKSIFKGAATKAGSAKGPFHDFYTALLAKGMKPTMARLTLARKIATITLLVWKKGVCFDAQQLKRQVSV